MSVVPETFAAARGTAAAASASSRRLEQSDNSAALLRTLSLEYLRFLFQRFFGYDQLQMLQAQVKSAGAEEEFWLAARLVGDRRVSYEAIAAACDLGRIAAVDGEGELVLILHGIRTRATWRGVVRRLLERDELGRRVKNREVALLDYGYFNALWFLSPVFPGALKARKISKQVAAIMRDDGDKKRLFVVGHSFGTFLARKLLGGNPNLRPSRLVFCGSVLRRDPRTWQLLVERSELVRNDYSVGDQWPMLAARTSLWFGESGTFGAADIGGRLLNVKWASRDHSFYLTEEFVLEHWHRFLFGHGPVVGGEADETEAPLHIRVIQRIPRVVAAVIPLAMLAVLARLFWPW